MKDRIINDINLVINALNTVTVCGKQNLANLSGSIEYLERITKTLSDCKIESITNTSE